MIRCPRLLFWHLATGNLSGSRILASLLPTFIAAAMGVVSELNFTGGAFYVVSNYGGEGPSSIVTSGDGVNWAGLDLGAINWGDIINPPLPFTMSSLAYNGSTYVI